jgi:ubiquinone/menaquinone biosynthesis C-methylase UbiE
MKARDILLKLLSVEYPESNIVGNIPIFAPRSEEDRRNDKYDRDFKYVDFYTGLIAFRHKTIRDGGCESLYRTINSIVLSFLKDKANPTLLDLGCGVGRIIYDLAENLTDTNFIGVDLSYNMLQRANDILFSNKTIEIDLSDRGFKKMTLNCKNLAENVQLAQANAMNLPFEDDSFNCVLNTFLVDRVPEPEKVIDESVRVLKKNGLLIFTDPLNYEGEFGGKDKWDNFGSLDKLITKISGKGININEAFEGLLVKNWKRFKHRRYYQRCRKLLSS